VSVRSTLGHGCTARRTSLNVGVWRACARYLSPPNTPLQRARGSDCATVLARPVQQCVSPRCLQAIPLKPTGGVLIVRRLAVRVWLIVVTVPDVAAVLFAIDGDHELAVEMVVIELVGQFLLSGSKAG
jgi:hypothetical protein